MRFKAVLFDLDGTLFDTAPDIMAACNKTLSYFGFSTLDESILRHKVADGMRAMMRLGVPASRWKETEPNTPMYNMFAQSYTQNCANLTIPFDGIEELIMSLHQSGIKLAVISNKYQNMINALFSNFPFTKAFEMVLGGDSCAHSKPHPEPILTALDKLKVIPADALYVGDFITDIQASKNAGCASCAVKWGYGQYDGDDIAKWGADFIANTPQDILDTVQKI